MYIFEIHSKENYIFIDDINDPNKMRFNLRGDSKYLYRDIAAPAFKKIQNGSDFIFESGYLINDNFTNCPLKIQNVTISSFEIISHKLNSKLTAYVNNKNNEQKTKNIEIITNSKLSSLPRMIECLNFYIKSGKDLYMIDTSIFQSDILFKSYYYLELIQLINNLKFEFYDIYVMRVGKDDHESTEIYISNLPESNYLSELFKTILYKLDSGFKFNNERLILFESQLYENEKEKEIIKDYLKYNIKEYFNPDLELLDRMLIPLTQINESK